MPAASEPSGEFVTQCADLGVEFDDSDIEKLGQYLALLLAVNEQTNLTAVRDEQTAWTRHIFDSLTLLPALADLPDGSRVIDVGSGGGLPGIPLAITMPQYGFTLLESSGKKVQFLRHAAKLLKLKNVTVVQERAEHAAQNRGERQANGTRIGAHREMYDAVIARAVGQLNSLAEITVPFAKVGGRVLLMKGAKAEEELVAAQKALHTLKAMYATTIETPTGRIVVLEKASATPKDYPRPDGEPTRKPL